jgi:hypothetical protein
MTPFDCGCTPDGTDRCARHKEWWCHVEPVVWDALVERPSACPPCRIAKWRSVSLSAEATPTRRAR